MSPDTAFSALDEEKFNRFHWRMLFTTGMGVFCDGYDLASLSIVLPLVFTSFGISHLGGVQAALLSASALLGSALGALIFGVLGQFGRKRYYGLDVLLMGLMAAAQALAPDLAWLIAFRFILGIGIGADYVLSPTITVEHANRMNRGKMIGIGFGVMWTLGATTTALFNWLLVHLNVSGDMQWRIVLAGGVIPALATLYLRRTMPETARYLARLAARPGAAQEVIRQISGQDTAAPEADNRPFRAVFAQHARMIFSAALLWMVFDMVVYPGDLFGPTLIAHNLGMQPIQYNLFTHIVFSLPSLLFYSLFALDQLGRKKLQTRGFIAAALFLLIFALLQHYLPNIPPASLLAYGLFSLSLNAATIVSGTGILGVELTPTRIRSFGQAITVIGGRMGAATSGFVFPLVFTGMGESWAIGMIAALALLGAWLTQRLIPETARRSLETINADNRPAGPAPGRDSLLMPQGPIIPITATATAMEIE